MLILCDRKMPQAAKAKLADYGEVVEFATQGITYEAISGHPDIFFCPTPGGLIVAPNLPEKYCEILTHHNIQYITGQFGVGKVYPESARYNSLVTGNFLIQNSAISDPSISQLNPDLEIISIKQGYVRCNFIALPNSTFMTSDHGIKKAFIKKGFEVLFVNPTGVKLDGFKHGFFGGTCGLYENTLFMCGSLHYYTEKEIIESYLAKAEVQLIELYNGQPEDVGTIMFLEERLT